MCKKANYPNILIISGFKDDRAIFWHGLKYANKIRELNSNESSKILYHINWEGGHDVFG